MSTERLYRTEGIVVRRRNQGEADRVLTLCTPLGKLDVVAKGARKVRSRKAGHIELFSRSSFVIARSRSSWDIVSQVEMLEPHAALRADLLRGTHARYAVELFDRDDVVLGHFVLLSARADDRVHGAFPCRIVRKAAEAAGSCGI